ncbi:MAG: hypothetical protein H6729_07630 [Deltaproteobacteria bacterium]|nr:hypothetical protein [Deltaproteobacteria bacterium]
MAINIGLFLTTHAMEGCAHRSATIANARSPVPTGRILWFERDTEAGYAWSFFLYIPDASVSASDHSRPLLVMPNNTGTTDADDGVHRIAALKQVFAWRSYAEKLHTALLVPTFPRPETPSNLYTHALDRDALLIQEGPLRRLDLQLIAMIDSAQRFLGAAPKSPVLLFGFSASGMFANRFALLHPERVLAVAVGSPGGWPMAPQSSWASDRLRYPLGSDDLADLVGAPLDLRALRRVSFFFFLGAKDVNDSLVFRDSYDQEDEVLAMKAFGLTPVERWPLAESMYRAAGISATFKLYPDTDHHVTKAMDADVIAFFSKAGE